MAKRYFVRSMVSVPTVTVFVVFLSRTRDTGNLTAGLTAVAETPRVERLETTDSQQLTEVVLYCTSTVL